MAVVDRSKAGEGITTQRKLAAILHADVVGYSRLMGQDEVGTHARLMACRREIDAVIMRYRGRIVGTAGDAVLADFPSVVEALSAAVAIQEAMAEGNRDLPDESRLEFRIGINLGDVISEGDDIFGDGVNVAARLEGLAAPGGIVISAAVYDQVKGKLAVEFEDRGSHRVKNIAEPIHVYGVGTADGKAVRVRAPRRRVRLAALAVAAAVGLIAAGAAGFAWLWPWVPSGPASTGKPTIAVLPFENRGGDPEQAYFSDGVTEDVITDLARFSNLQVLSWNAVAPYRGDEVTPEQVGHDLNVRYVVGGTVRQAGERLRVTVQLTDAERGVLLWSERYDGDLDDVFAVQEQIAQNVVATLAIRLTRLEQERAFARPTDNLDAYQNVLRGRQLLGKRARSANFEAQKSFERAIELDSGYSAAYAGLADAHFAAAQDGYTEWPHREVQKAHDLAQKAIELDDTNATAHALLSHVYSTWGQYDLALSQIDRALELNPNDTRSRAQQGSVLLFAGRPAEAIEPLEQAMRFDPDMGAISLNDLGQSYYLEGRYGAAIRVLERNVSLHPDFVAGHATLAAAYAQAGRENDAAREAALVRRLHPFFEVDAFGHFLSSPGHRERVAEGLRKAGLE